MYQCGVDGQLLSQHVNILLKFLDLSLITTSHLMNHVVIFIQRTEYNADDKQK